MTGVQQQSSEAVQHLAALSPAAGAGDNNSLLRMANGMANEGAYDAAIPLYRRAYQTDGDTASLIGLGRALSAAGEYQKAANVFKTSDDPEAVRGLANAYTAMGRPAEALPLLDKVLAKNPVDVDALNSRAVVLDLTGRHDDATATFQRGLEIDPQHAGLRHNYGLSLALAGTDFPRAIELLKSTAASPAATAAERQTLALAYALSGDDTTAGHLLSIDLGVAETSKKLAWFEVVKALPPTERMRAVMSGSVPPKPEIPAPAVRDYGAPDVQKTETAARVAAEAPPVPAAPQAAAVETKPVGDMTAVKAEPRQSEQNPVAAPAPEEPSKSAAPAPKDPPKATAGTIPLQTEAAGWQIQIASYRLIPNLEKGWRILKAKYADVLATLEPDYAMIDFGNHAKRPKGKYYRLLAGPFKSRAEAVNACHRLEAEGAECILRAPGAATSGK